MSLKIPQSFYKLAGGLHQDIDLEANEGFAPYCLGFLTAQDQAELAPFLQTVLATLDSAEIKGLLKKTTAARRFSAKEARQFLEEVLSELTLPR